MTDILDNIEHAAECSCWTHYARKCDCWRAAIVEYVRQLEADIEADNARWRELMLVPTDAGERIAELERKLAAAREALERIVQEEQARYRGWTIAKETLAALANDAPEPDEWDGITPHKQGG